MQRLWRVIRRAFLGAPDTQDWRDIATSILTLIFPFVGAILSPQGLLAGALLTMLLLVGRAAYQLQGLVDEHDKIQPLHPAGIDREERFWRLRINNPNSFVAHGCYIDLVDFCLNDGSSEIKRAPSRGFRFMWSSHASMAGEQRQIDLGRGANQYVGIIIDRSTPTRPKFEAYGWQFAGTTREWFGSGIYNLEVDIGSNEVPPRRTHLRIACSSESGVTLTLVG